MFDLIAIAVLLLFLAIPVIEVLTRDDWIPLVVFMAVVTPIVYFGRGLVGRPALVIATVVLAPIWCALAGQAIAWTFDKLAPSLTEGQNNGL